MSRPCGGASATQGRAPAGQRATEDSEELRNSASKRGGAADAVRVVVGSRAELPRLNDATPILMMPVRIETRFKTFSIPGPIPGHHLLLVRIYPDDCWIDSFDPRLTEAEAASARAYWVGIWEAGGIEEQERAAWRSLVRAHGPGVPRGSPRPSSLRTSRPDRPRQARRRRPDVGDDSPLPERRGSAQRRSGGTHGSRKATPRSWRLRGRHSRPPSVTRARPKSSNAPPGTSTCRFGEGVKRESITSRPHCSCWM